MILPTLALQVVIVVTTLSPSLVMTSVIIKVLVTSAAITLEQTVSIADAS